MGQFLQRNPSGYEDSVNLYAGFANDPVNNGDPTGKNVPRSDDICFGDDGVIHSCEQLGIEDDPGEHNLEEGICVAGPQLLIHLLTGFVHLGSPEGLGKDDEIRRTLRALCGVSNARAHENELIAYLMLSILFLDGPAPGGGQR